MKELDDHALKSLEHLWDASVVFLAVWILFLPGAVEQMKKHDAAVQMTTWKLLADLVSKRLTIVGGESHLIAGWTTPEDYSDFLREPPFGYKFPLLGVVCPGYPDPA